MKARRILIAVLYWVAVLTLSLALAVALLLLLERRDASQLPISGPSGAPAFTQR